MMVMPFGFSHRSVVGSMTPLLKEMSFQFRIITYLKPQPKEKWRRTGTAQDEQTMRDEIRALSLSKTLSSIRYSN
jgi:hypothetical protein